MFIVNLTWSTCDLACLEMTKIQVPPQAVQSNLRFPKLGFQFRNLQRMHIWSTTATERLWIWRMKMGLFKQQDWGIEPMPQWLLGKPKLWLKRAEHGGVELRVEPTNRTDIPMVGFTNRIDSSMSQRACGSYGTCNLGLLAGPLPWNSGPLNNVVPGIIKSTLKNQMLCWICWSAGEQFWGVYNCVEENNAFIIYLIFFDQYLGNESTSPIILALKTSHNSILRSHSIKTMKQPTVHTKEKPCLWVVFREAFSSRKRPRSWPAAVSRACRCSAVWGEWPGNPWLVILW